MGYRGPVTSAAHDPRDAERRHHAMGAVLMLIRETRGLSRREVVEASGVKYPVLANLESGRRRLSENMLQRMAPVLQVSADRLRSLRDQIERGVRPVDEEGILPYLEGATDEPPPGFRPDTLAMAVQNPPYPNASAVLGAGISPVLDPQPPSGSFDDVLSEALWLCARINHDSEYGPVLRDLFKNLRQLSPKDIQRVTDFANGVRSARDH